MSTETKPNANDLSPLAPMGPAVGTAFLAYSAVEAGMRGDSSSAAIATGVAVIVGLSTVASMLHVAVSEVVKRLPSPTQPGRMPAHDADHSPVATL